MFVPPAQAALVPVRGCIFKSSSRTTFLMTRKQNSKRDFAYAGGQTNAYGFSSTMGWSFARSSAGKYGETPMGKSPTSRQSSISRGENACSSSFLCPHNDQKLKSQARILLEEAAKKKKNAWVHRD